MSVVLNALAIEFVYSFDKEIASSIWYDPGQRFLRAAIIEMHLKGELLLEPFYTKELMCSTYDIDPSTYDMEIGGPMKDREQAEKDRMNPKFMTPKDKLWLACAEVAKEEESPEALWQFSEMPAYFGTFDKIYKPRTGSVFNRYMDYFTWSRWEKILFLPAVPEIGQTSKFKGLPSNQQRKGATLYNFDPYSKRAVVVRVMVAVLEVLFLKSLVHSVTTVYRRRNYQQIPVRIIDGILEWFVFFFVVLAFPSGLLFYLYLIFGCEPLA